MDETRREQAAVLALTAHARSQWHLVSRLLSKIGSASAIADGEISPDEEPELISAIDCRALPIESEEITKHAAVIEAMAAEDITLLTVLDEEYPRNLRLVYDRPPFLFVRGHLDPADVRALAVVGTRQASDEGLAQADGLARSLAERGVTVVSGLARGIDTAAHRGALAAGGRTIAVLGTGITVVYPAENAGLADEIVASGGALVSQFWPDSPPTRYRFPMRNRTMSGLALGTVVVEASHTSGARMQARVAIEHGKRVFLVEGLVTKEQWAQRYRDHAAATHVSSAEDVLGVVDRLDEPVDQLTLI
ncbi:MAG TPA: DNA-processing protein DprA [Gaiellaceae bacterium]|nr:DNA-processing protein DprA [Gaiellaceae bacterium]